MANYPQVFNFSYNEDVSLRATAIAVSHVLQCCNLLHQHEGKHNVEDLSVRIAGGQLPPGGQQASTAQAGHAEIST